MRRHDPFEQMDRMFENVRRLMWDIDHTGVGRGDSEMESNGSQSFVYSGTPHLTTNLQERDGEYVLVVDVPGFEREEIDVRYDDGEFFLSGRHEDEVLGDRTFDERVYVPEPIVAEEISATYRNGVLTVTMPIDESHAASRRIPISD